MGEVRRMRLLHQEGVVVGDGADDGGGGAVFVVRREENTASIGLHGHPFNDLIHLSDVRPPTPNGSVASIT